MTTWNQFMDEIEREAQEEGHDSLDQFEELSEYYKKRRAEISLNKDELMTWYVGPLSKERLAELRHKLAKARGLLVSFINYETDDKELLPTTQQVKDILKETEDP